MFLDTILRMLTCLLLISESLTSVPLPVSTPLTFAYAGIAPPVTGLVFTPGIDSFTNAIIGAYARSSCSLARV